MFSSALVTAGVAAIAAATTAVAASLPEISVVGNKFFDPTGKQFFIKGVAYQLIPHDPLMDTEQCTLDAKAMKSLGANTIRVYHVDPKADHDGCMAAFADNGIYILVDLDDFATDIDPLKPTWTDSQYKAYSAIFDVFAQYSNTLGVFIGNEVIARANQSEAAPYIKAATRDMKAYRDKKGFRKIPVGYSAADIAELRPMLQDYLTCGDKVEETVDFFGLNAYEWCAADNDFQTSGYKTLNDMTAGYPVPIFFSETGCNTARPRLFLDQNAILGPEMNDLWSGAIVYEWIEEANNYGLISYGPPQKEKTGANIEDGFLRKGTPTPVQPDFSNLQAVWKTNNPTGTAKANYKPKLTAPACPKSTAGGWLLDGDVALPTLNQVFTASATNKPTGGGKNQSPTPTGADSPTGTGSTDPTGTNAAAGREISGVTGALAAVMLGFAVLL
ncbi:hypothetical protein V494_00565 [Pseudogymnoascus sp. VKM F-4513 (FW-928)]|nr:hypothetical protein V494_00565 [Pseudogymnoascus sp. VKM F-4513 (FW-928)]